RLHGEAAANIGLVDVARGLRDVAARSHLQRIRDDGLVESDVSAGERNRAAIQVQCLIHLNVRGIALTTNRQAADIVQAGWASVKDKALRKRGQMERAVKTSAGGRSHRQIARTAYAVRRCAAGPATGIDDIPYQR